MISGGRERFAFAVTVVGHRMHELQEPAEFSGVPVIPILSL